MIGFFLLISETPCKLTPGKQHHIFVPETPTGKNGRRKSDGTQVVKESPNIDALKRENGRTLTASLLVRSRSSFYSGDYFFTSFFDVSTIRIVLGYDPGSSGQTSLKRA